MRILHVTHQYPPEFVGGVEVYTQSLAQNQTELGHTVAIFTRGQTGGQNNSQSYKVESLPEARVHTTNGEGLSANQRFLATFGQSTRDNSIVEQFGRLLDEFQPEIIHVQHMMGLPILCFDLITARGIPFVVTLWDFWWICANAQLLTNYDNTICNGPNAYLNCTRCAIARSNQVALWAGAPLLTGILGWRGRLLKQALAQADTLIAPTHFVHKWHVDRGVVGKEIRVIKPGVEGFLAQQTERATDGPLRFFYLGGIAPQKGVHVALEAFSQLEGNAELWIAGDDSVDPTYTARLQALATPSVRFLGRLSRQQVAETLAQVDLFLAPSIWYETFCFVVHEAFSAGVPAIGSNLGAIAEGIQHGVDGLLAEPNNVASWQAAMQHLVDDPKQVKRLRNGVKEPLSQQSHAEQILALYRSL